MIGKRCNFGELNTGDIFYYVSNGSPAGARFRKASPREAIQQLEDGSGDLHSVDALVKTARSTKIALWLPDPTEEERQAFRLRVLNNTIDNMISSAHSAEGEVEKLMARGQDGWYSLFGSSGAVEAQMKAAAMLHVALQARKILEHAEGGFEALQTKARENAMRYARYGHHSTSAVSNVAEEMQAAAWAEVAAMCGGL